MRQFACHIVAGLMALFPALEARAQWLPNGPPNVVEHQFIYTGGISYFSLTGHFSGGFCCQRIVGYNILPAGTNLEQVIEQEKWGDACIALDCPPWNEEWVSVLGNLAPGTYNLALRTNAIFPNRPSAIPWTNYSFTVPTNSGPTMNMSAVTTSDGPQLLIQVAGVSNVVYALQSSTDLTNWSVVQTNLGGPVTFTVSPTNAAPCYFRTAIYPPPFP